MSTRDERAQRRRGGQPTGGDAQPAGAPPGSYARVGCARPEDAERLFAGAVLATAGAMFEIHPPDGQAAVATTLPSHLFVAVVPDAYAPLAPLFAMRGVGRQPWGVAGQFGWSAAGATDDQPPRVALKLDFTAPLSISAKVLFLPQFPGIRDALGVAARGGFIALMSASQWNALAELAREGLELATFMDRAVMVPIAPAVYLPSFLANLPRYDN